MAWGPKLVKKEMIWESFTDVKGIPGFHVSRAKVAGGWLVMVNASLQVSLTFYPDPTHAWDGSTLPL